MRSKAVLWKCDVEVADIRGLWHACQVKEARKVHSACAGLLPSLCVNKELQRNLQD